LSFAKVEMDGNLWIVKYIVDAKEEYLVGVDNLKIIP
jgi:hypothetical protein